MKKIIVVTGGAGFVGSHLIELFLKRTNKNIISIDNYSTGSRKSCSDNRAKYLNGQTHKISNLLKIIKICEVVFHFGEFSRIYQSFLKFDECFKSNSLGKEVFNFCLKIK